MEEMGADVQKRAAAARAIEYVRGGMTVGLGSGSTAEIVVTMLGGRVREGLQISGVPTSEKTAALARSLDIPLLDLQSCPRLDVTIDGADEVDPRLNLIKGHGGALLREKLVAEATDFYVIVVDAGKQVSRLGERFPVPVEIIRFAWTGTRQRLLDLGFAAMLRGGGQPYITDGGNYILDCTAPAGLDLSSAGVADGIKLQTGVVEHGLFLSMAQAVVIGTPDGGVQVKEQVTELG